jgi:hypothetical protein
MAQYCRFESQALIQRNNGALPHSGGLLNGLFPSKLCHDILEYFVEAKRGNKYG